MSRDWESVFTKWAKGPSEAEQEKAENSKRQINQAIQASRKLKTRKIKVFAQGSYKNRVNVQRDSDVDIGVVYCDAFLYGSSDYVKAELNKKLDFTDYIYPVFKNDVEEALVARFGRDAVTRGSKSFDVTANTCRVESDVAAFFEYRLYASVTDYISGVVMLPDNGSPSRIINWPDQHYENGVSKNHATGRRYKRVVRILKKLSNEMANEGMKSAKDTPSFLIECLVFNASNLGFECPAYKDMVRNVLAELFYITMTKERCRKLGEVSKRKRLFAKYQPWSMESANQFLGDAWHYIGYK